jgi:hypothetical protein
MDTKATHDRLVNEAAALSAELKKLEAEAAQANAANKAAAQ